MADLAAEHERQHDVDSEHCQKLRAETERLYEERNAASKASQDAWNADQKDVAKQKSDEAKELKVRPSLRLPFLVSVVHVSLLSVFSYSVQFGI